MRIIFFYDKRSLNDATLHYIKIIEQSAVKTNIEFVYCSEMINIKADDIIFTITSLYFVKAKLRGPFNKTIFWSQGIGPEEYLMRGGANLIKYFLKKVFAFISINKSDLLFVVSNEMLDYYRVKYKYHKSRFMIMPCYNLGYDSGTVVYSEDRYKKPSFVYAGNLAVWQCVDESLQIFQKIQSTISSASLTLLVKERELALNLVEKYKLKNVNVKYVKLELLQEELKKYKYGFIIREDSIVNNVATPTKMNSYLASGVIPIFTDAIHSFVENIRLGPEFTICLNSRCTIEEKAQFIIGFENQDISVEKLDANVQQIFLNYYNDNKYINEISSKLREHLRI